MYAYISGVVLDGEGLAAVLEVLVAIASRQSVGERVVGVHLGDRLTHVVQHAEHARRALYIIVDAPTGTLAQVNRYAHKMEDGTQRTVASMRSHTILLLKNWMGVH